MADALAWSSRLVALSVALQTLELLTLRRAFSAGGPLAGVNARGFLQLLWLQLALCAWVALVGASPFLLGVFATYWLLIARLGAPFNGGSDAMTSLSLLMLGIAACDPWQSVIMQGAMAYLGVQTVFSYFVAGLTKLKERGWRRGTALVHFANLAKYGVPPRARALLAKPRVALAASWAILLFECSFPCALRSEWCCVVYLSVGAAFHLANALLFGLNRFLFSWLAVYPVVLAMSNVIAGLRGSQ
jgi:hypothetical protein